MKKTAVVIAPGRGTYNKAELGYLARRHANQGSLIDQFDGMRAGLGQTTLRELDGAERYSIAKHTRGDNASALIYACAYSDFLAIDQDDYDIVAVTGNSMGWYIALACAGALSPVDGFTVVNTMGTLMQEHLIGGQIIYPYTDQNWVEIPGARLALLRKCIEISTRKDHHLSVSIDLGGLMVLAGNEAGLAAFEHDMPVTQDRFPMRLANHAAFHSSLQDPVAKLGRNQLNPDLFEQPDIPLVDGRGGVWHPKASDLNALYGYTLGHQVTEPYDFAAAVTIAAKEFNPDTFIVLGPGSTLTGSVAQSLIRNRWKGMENKADFKAIQADQNLIWPMGA